MLVNCTLAVPTMVLEQYLFKATLYRVRPAGFTKQLELLTSYVSQWEVTWVEDTDGVHTAVFMARALSFVSVNITSQQVISVALPVPSRANLTAPSSPHSLTEYQLTHIGESGMHTVQLAPFGGADPNGPGARELIMLTTNITFRPDDAPGQHAGGSGSDGSSHSPSSSSSSSAGAPSAALYGQLRRFLANNVAHQSSQQHVLMGIVTPPVVLDLAYTQNLVQLPASMPAGYFGFVNLVALHLSQGPRAASPDATVLLPDVWTHLLWGIQRCVGLLVFVCWDLHAVHTWIPMCEHEQGWFVRTDMHGGILGCMSSTAAHVPFSNACSLLCACTWCCCCLLSVLSVPAVVYARTNKNVVTLSNVTLWVPAAEFSFIRFHTTEQAASFTINLQGMRKDVLP